MPADRDQFEHWLTEWKDHTWALPSASQWSRLQLASSDVHEQTRRILAIPSPDGLERLATVSAAVRAQRDRQNRCRASIADDVQALREAGGTWSEIADWTTMDEKAVRSIVRGPRPRTRPDARLDEELADLLSGAPDNPFFRISDLLTASRFFEAVANELDDVTDWLCFELSSSGMGRTQVARSAQISQLTLARRISRARRSRWQRGAG